MIEYEFDRMSAEVPKCTSAVSPRATWTLHGIVRIRTNDRDSPGAIGIPSGNGASSSCTS